MRGREREKKKKEREFQNPQSKADYLFFIGEREQDLYIYSSSVYKSNLFNPTNYFIKHCFPK